jgi:hypothetical protein
MYDELLAAVRARVNRYVNSGDSQDMVDPAGVRDAQALMAAAHALPRRRGKPASLIDAQHAAGLLYYARHVVVSAGDDETDLDLCEPLLRPVFDHVPELADQIGELAQVPKRPVRLNPRRVAVFAFGGAPLNEVDAILAMSRHAVLVAADEGADTLPLRMNVAEAQQLRYGRTSDVADLTDAVTTVREVLAATPVDDPTRADRLTTLGLFLQLRYGSTFDSADLDASIEASEEALSVATTEDEDRPMYLSNLGRARLTRYAYASHDPADLDAGLDQIRTAVATTLANDLGRGTRLSALHQAYRLRFARTGNLLDLEAALNAAYEAVEATMPEHPDHTERVLAIGTTHLARYERTGDQQDAGLAIDIARQVRRAVAKDHPLHAVAREVQERARH